jgi:hypothetical protein
MTMFTWLANLGDVTHAVQLALTPAFLFMGMAGILNVMANRLARIIDRARVLTDQMSSATELSEPCRQELSVLGLRRRAASNAITMCVLSALLICSVVSVMFLEALLDFNLRWLIGALFMGSTLALVFGLAFFLREVHLATRNSYKMIPSMQRKKH